MKLGAGDDPFDYISKLRCICESVKVLDIKSDDFLKFFAWRGLDEEFKRELVQITTKTNPSIQEILDNFFTSCERVESSRKLKAKSSKDKNSNLHKAQASNTSSMAVKVDSADFKGARCVLCSNLEGGKVDHVIYKCSKFPTPQAKVEKLKSLNGCTWCASLSHLTNKCAFRFKRKCVKCSGWHFSYLCSKSTTQKSTDSQENNSSIVLFNFW